jgi:hypothetical protein
LDVSASPSVVAHAQHDEVDGAGQGGQGASAGRFTRFRCFIAGIERDEPGLGARRVTQQGAADQSLVAGGIARWHPALVGQGDGDVTPAQRLEREAAEQIARRASARHHEAGPVARGQGLIEQIAYRAGKAVQQGRAVGKGSKFGGHVGLPSSSCQVRPSRSIMAMAADGPQVPAA